MTSEDVAPAVDDYNSDDDDCDFDNYYDDCDMDMNDAREEEEKKLDADGELAKYECLDTFAVERLLNEHVACLVDVSQVTPSLAKILLHSHNWDGDKVAGLLRTDMDGVLAACGVKAAPKQTRPSPATHRMTRSSASRAVSPPQPSSSLLPSTTCGVCYGDGEEMKALCCAHSYCLSCWRAHFEARLSEGVASRIECMTPNCSLVCPGEFVVRILDKATLKAKYERFVFRDYVTSHPELRFCVGKDCQVVIRSKEQRAKKVTCAECNTSFCVLCGIDYHAPTSCETIKKWLIKCADDSETANYISAHTKDCPQCHACIEKNGGCNHMQCAKCKHHFCWMCFGDWKTHGSEYYECSRYKENPAVAAEANHMKARRALEKYLHYFERFENHNKSLKLEEELKEKIRRKIDAKVSEHDGTWIDWQHLHEAAGLLTRCRYTLQYTYPYAYYMDGGARKELFEYQQAQLEKEVEELAWAVERPEPTARALLEAHIHRAEHKRLSLLHAFF